MVDWFKAAADAFQGKKMNILVKGDDASKYPSLQGVIIAFKKNDLMKFQVVTASIPVPAGTDLYNEQQKSGTKAVE
jgi:hypothetical protein